jgi:hypothetical protein
VYDTRQAAAEGVARAGGGRETGAAGAVGTAGTTGAAGGTRGTGGAGRWNKYSDNYGAAGADTNSQEAAGKGKAGKFAEPFEKGSAAALEAGFAVSTKAKRNADAAAAAAGAAAQPYLDSAADVQPTEHVTHGDQAGSGKGDDDDAGDDDPIKKAT